MSEEIEPVCAEEEWERKRSILREAVFKLGHGEGLTPGRIQHATPWILRILGVPSAQAACDLIRSTLDNLEQDKFCEAIRNAFGGEGHPKSSRERREQLAAKCGVSVGTIGKREEVAAGLVADQLIFTMQARVSMEPENQGVLVAALLGLQQAVIEQTVIMREINNRLRRLGD